MNTRHLLRTMLQENPYMSSASAATSLGLTRQRVHILRRKLGLDIGTISGLTCTNMDTYTATTIKEMRINKGMNQADWAAYLSALLARAGVDHDFSAKTVSRWESGDVTPRNVYSLLALREATRANGTK